MEAQLLGLWFCWSHESTVIIAIEIIKHVVYIIDCHVYCDNRRTKSTVSDASWGL